jgi:hypothetical protein
MSPSTSVTAVVPLARVTRARAPRRVRREWLGSTAVGLIAWALGGAIAAELFLAALAGSGLLAFTWLAATGAIATGLTVGLILGLISERRAQVRAGSSPA